MPDYKGKESYAPEQTDKINTLDKRFIELSGVKIRLFTIPTIVVLTTLILILLNKKARRNTAVYISLSIGILHFYHHYTLTKLQNKYVQ